MRDTHTEPHFILSRTNPYTRFWTNGPLILDCLKDRAFMETEYLKLTEEQFFSLYFLVQDEGQRMSFDDLYEAAWEQPDRRDRREAAWDGLNRLAEMVNAAGAGLARIEAATEGYCYRLGGDG